MSARFFPGRWKVTEHKPAVFVVVPSLSRGNRQGFAEKAQAQPVACDCVGWREARGEDGGAVAAPDC